MTSSGAAWFGGLENDVLAELRAKSQKAIYKSDPEAWLWDVLGFRWHEKQREIADSFLNTRRTAVKSSNGSGKSRMWGELQTWGIATHDIGELLIINSAPGARQIEEVTFAYLAHNYSVAKARGFVLPGRFSDKRLAYQPSWRDKSKSLIIGQKPSDNDIIGTFQGIRAIGEPGAKTWVFLDEGGALHADMFVAAEAVTTGAADHKIGVIGNPDKIGTYFQKIFEDKEVSQDWSKHTISAFDLPTFTGENVYPDNPELQKGMLESGMIDHQWVEQKKRAWGEDSARYKSKVLGEFSDVEDRCFFSQTAINTAMNTEIEEDMQIDLHGGLDLARFGEDESMMYGNRGGRIRKLDSWSKATANESATRAHTLCLEHAISVLVIDVAGLGGPIFDQIAARNDRYYTIIKALGNEKSPDLTRWRNARAWWFDTLREGMLTGQVDLDLFVDEQLREELLMIQYDFTEKGAIQIESKKDMAKRGIKSPDTLDAVVYSYMQTQLLIDSPLAGLQKGDIVTKHDEFDDLALSGVGMPI